MKAVIVDLRGEHAAALRDDGCVVKIPDAGYTLGQVIELHERARPRWRRTVFSLAAAAALLLSIGGAAYATPYGVVTLDADTSLSYTINLFDYVLDVRAADSEGETLLKELDLGQVRHRRVDSAISSTVEQLSQRRQPDESEPAYTVSAETRSERHSQRLRQELERTVLEIAPLPAPAEENRPALEKLPEPRPAEGPSRPQEGTDPAGEENAPGGPQDAARPAESGALPPDRPENPGNVPGMSADRPEGPEAAPGYDGDAPPEAPAEPPSLPQGA